VPSSAALRLQIERSLETRFPAALTPAPRTIRETAATGIASVDELLDGGFPVGAISEIVGPACSGRTSLALAFLAVRTGEERFCAWVDAEDAFDPESAAASGVRLGQLLWVRCGCSKKRQEKNWTRLEQALQATDLLLQAGGFAAIVLDLGGIDPSEGMRIPLATWFRYRQAADRTRASLLVLGRDSYAQSSAAVVLDAEPMRVKALGGTVLHAGAFALSRRRQRFPQQWNNTRKPPVSTWTASAQWAVEQSA
jgi:RecA/RadA recombinase